MGRVDLAYMEMRDRLKPVNWFGNIDRNDIRYAWRTLRKQQLKNQKSFDHAAKQFNEAVEKGDTLEVYKAYSLLSVAAIHEVESDVHTLLNTVLICRREVRLLIDDRKKENLKGKDDKEYKLLMRYQKSTQSWFNSVVSHNSLTIQLSDMNSLRNEILHLMDMFNLQTSVRTMSKTRKKVENEKAHLTAEAYKSLEKDFEKLGITINDFLNMLDHLWTDVIKLMQLETSDCTNKMQAILRKMAELKYPEQDYAELRKIYDHTQQEFNALWKELTEQLNALINIERAA